MFAKDANTIIDSLHMNIVLLWAEKGELDKIEALAQKKKEQKWQNYLMQARVVALVSR